PVAVATGRRVVLDNWDRTAINLPFSRLAMVAGDAVTVPADADGATLENRRQSLEQSLNRATVRAYELADRRTGETTLGSPPAADASRLRAGDGRRDPVRSPAAQSPHAPRQGGSAAHGGAARRDHGATAGRIARLGAWRERWRAGRGHPADRAP